MEFEYDVGKSEANYSKHGIDFQEAQTLWQDEYRIEFPARSDDELRVMLIAQMRGRVWAAFYTLRGDRIRIISVRRARDYEKEDYFSRRIGREV